MNIKLRETGEKKETAEGAGEPPGELSH
jgi:hypothetical protein